MQNNHTQTSQPNFTVNGKSRRGFASMDKARHKLVSSQGGKSPRSKAEEQPKPERSRYEGF